MKANSFYIIPDFAIAKHNRIEYFLRILRYIIYEA